MDPSFILKKLKSFPFFFAEYIQRKMMKSLTIRRKNTLLITTLLLSADLLIFAQADYKVGIGIADITGPVAEVVFVSNIY